MTWDEYYNSMEARAAYDKLKCFPPDEVMSLIFDKYDNLEEIEYYFKMKLKGNKNEKSRKTSSKRAK